jgi:hypothetical protein|tara:strand:+ start:3236 stop:3565 length:330 start_codon:yes stop_codon:yes gene_type:complete
MSNINEENLATIVIDLSPETIDESYLRMLGGQIELLLTTMFGGSFIPAKFRGTNTQISSFARALGNEKRYLQSFEKFGLGDSRTLDNRHKLEKAIGGFESETGIKWPFK